MKRHSLERTHAKSEITKEELVVYIQYNTLPLKDLRLLLRDLDLSFTQAMGEDLEVHTVQTGNSITILAIAVGVGVFFERFAKARKHWYEGTKAKEEARTIREERRRASEEREVDQLTPHEEEAAFRRLEHRAALLQPKNTITSVQLIYRGQKVNLLEL